MSWGDAQRGGDSSAVCERLLAMGLSSPGVLVAGHGGDSRAVWDQLNHVQLIWFVSSDAKGCQVSRFGPSWAG